MPIYWLVENSPLPPEISMSRFAITFCFSFMLLCSVGCQMYHNPHDHRIPAFVHRHSDYRGFDPNHRAGSVLVGAFGPHQMSGDLFFNAGDFGITTPVTMERRHIAPGVTPSTFGTTPIAVPPHPPSDTFPRSIDTGEFTPDRSVPSIQDLLDRQRRTTPDSTPITPPAIPRTVPSPFDDVPSDTVPFSPSDEILSPPSTIPTFLDMEPPISLEELQRQDPSIHDLQIISIEDAGASSLW